jgi:hypothetical protein
LLVLCFGSALQVRKRTATLVLFEALGIVFVASSAADAWACESGLRRPRSLFGLPLWKANAAVHGSQLLAC